MKANPKTELLFPSKSRMTETKHIAVIDDHLMVRKGLCALINLFEPYKVLFDADNGREMISMIDPNQLPDIILLDINMPEMDGFETANWLKTNYPQIKVLALSTMESETAIIKMIQNGARGYIFKDSDPEELKTAFDNVLRTGYHYNDSITHMLANSFAKGYENSKARPDAKHITPRELEFLQLACSEKTYHEIAKKMGISERTVENYREALCKKFNVTSRIGLVIYGIKKNFIQL